jgi:hypothetical protein
VALTAGCKQNVLCPMLGDCGGPIPSGDYVLDPTHPSCSEDLWTPPPDPRLKQADLPPARTPFPEPAHFDWCNLIGTGQGTDIVKNKPPFLYAESAPIGNATLHYDAASMSYSLSTMRTGKFFLDMPAYCMRAFGAQEMGGMNLCQRLQTDLQAGIATKYRNVQCGLDPNDLPGQEGCLCTFDLVEVTHSAGRIIPTSGNTITHLPGNEFPQLVTYCNQGDRLQITGGDGEYLFDRVGLRTMDMVKITVNCTDGMLGPGEDGVDCGPACPMLCPP